MFYKKIILILSIFLLTIPVSAKINPINAEKNAQSRNNSGVEYMQEKDYLAAIKEFKIAIAINPNHQTSAIYHNNLGRAYIEMAKVYKEYKMPKQSIEFAHFAEISFENAINQDCMQLNFYKNLVESFELQNILASKRKEYLKKTENPFNSIIVAFIEEKMGNKTTMQIILDDFIAQYPDLIITISLKNFLSQQ
ncbi:MAG: hypothetical protein E7Z91_00630 [Cyanobacteria bacterium SIG30]|nr:hypothetical protein [Cyanobacteria bacterium SIG30]